VFDQRRRHLHVDHSRCEIGFSGVLVEEDLARSCATGRLLTAGGLLTSGLPSSILFRVGHIQ